MCNIQAPLREEAEKLWQSEQALQRAHAAWVLTPDEDYTLNLVVDLRKAKAARKTAQDAFVEALLVHLGTCAACALDLAGLYGLNVQKIPDIRFYENKAVTAAAIRDFVESRKD